MSHTATGEQSKITVRLQQLFVLAMVSLLLWVATRVVPEAGGGLSAVAATGFLLLAGTLASEQLEWFQVPHLTAYIIAGIIAGPYVLHLIDEKTVEQLSTANPLADRKSVV